MFILYETRYMFIDKALFYCNRYQTHQIYKMKYVYTNLQMPDRYPYIRFNHFPFCFLL